MAKLLIHIHSGPELKNKLTLGLLVAKTGVAEGHSVKLFLAADAVHALNCRAEGEIVGQGTGDANLHLQALAAAMFKSWSRECLRKRAAMMTVFSAVITPPLRCLISSFLCLRRRYGAVLLRL